MKLKFQQFQTTTILLALLVVAMAVATFIESSKGVQAARRLVYDATWFEVLLAFLTVNTVFSLLHYRSFAWQKISVPLFHLAFVLVMAGAFFTRYTGFEGSVSVREGESTNHVVVDGTGYLQLPFSIHLNDFVLERYPGSHSPSSYSSFVRVVDPERDKQFDYHIFMNNILKYRGWRFFQTSYDQDEKGTLLTASRDVIGTPMTYAGYFISIVAMLLSLFMPGTFFRNQLSKLKNTVPILLLILMPLAGITQVPNPEMVVPKEKAKDFGQLVVQDSRGRMKTVNTLNNEFMRKIVGKEKLGGLTPDQLVLSLMAYPEYWSSYPFVKIKNSELREQLSVQGKYASFEYFFDNQKQYRLSGMINHVFIKPKNQQNKTDKALIELDDKINIIHGFISGRALSIFPIHEADNHKWHNVTDAWQYAVSSEDSLYLQNIIGVYLIELRNGMKNGDFSNADQYLESIKVYQEAVGKDVIPEKSKLKAELFYNKANLFKWLKIAYGMVGLLSLLILLFLLFGKGTFNPGFTTVLTIVALVLIAVHSAGIGLRWYVGGFVPLSNAYETMIFISWIGVLSGIVIARKQPLALALSLLVGFTFLLVAGFNNSNPEIGNLVPVLKSPWLSIHVAVITSSYALFAIVMLAAFINIVAYLVMNTANQISVRNRITQLGHMMQVLLVVGLYTLTIGTIFGAVWANESWGRYWGWDPKETWALISIFVYAFVSHMRLIPSLKNDFWFNLSAFWAFAAILMTFFGVNYFLTGMHSYAGTGDAVVPAWLFWIVLILIAISVSSGIRELLLRKAMQASVHDE